MAGKLALLALVCWATWGCGGADRAPRIDSRPNESSNTRNGEPTTGTSENDRIPNFPWPPPKPSGMVVIPDAQLRQSIGSQPTLGALDERFRKIIEEGGYLESAYFAVPDGYAFVTRLEQIDEDGTPKAGPKRWEPELGPMRGFSLSGYLKSLFTAEKGYYRILVFVVSPHPVFASPTQKVSREEANAWLVEGAGSLPASIKRRPYGSEVVCTALIYEFEQPEKGADAKIRVPGRLPGRIHLEKARLWRAFGP